MNLKRKLAALAIAALAALPLSADEAGDAIVRTMDGKMNFPSCRMVIRIEDQKANGKLRSLRARVEYLESGGTRIEFIEPAREKGKRVLMAGGSMWMAAPGVSKPVRLSGKDAFMGTSFTNDDAMNFDKSDDYDASIASQDAEGWNLVLTARKAGLPYPRIEARIGRDYLPISMSFFTRSGKESKRVEYSDTQDFSGRRRPSTMTVTDLMTSGALSRIIFEEITEGAVDPSRFSPTSLGK